MAAPPVLDKLQRTLLGKTVFPFKSYPFSVNTEVVFHTNTTEELHYSLKGDVGLVGFRWLAYCYDSSPMIAVHAVYHVRQPRYLTAAWKYDPDREMWDPWYLSLDKDECVTIEPFSGEDFLNGFILGGIAFLPFVEPTACSLNGMDVCEIDVSNRFYLLLSSIRMQEYRPLPTSLSSLESAVEYAKNLPSLFLNAYKIQKAEQLGPDSIRFHTDKGDCLLGQVSRCFQCPEGMEYDPVKQQCVTKQGECHDKKCVDLKLRLVAETDVNDVLKIVFKNRLEQVVFERDIELGDDPGIEIFSYRLGCYEATGFFSFPVEIISDQIASLAADGFLDYYLIQFLGPLGKNIGDIVDIEVETTVEERELTPEGECKCAPTGDQPAGTVWDYDTCQWVCPEGKVLLECGCVTPCPDNTTLCSGLCPPPIKFITPRAKVYETERTTTIPHIPCEAILCFDITLAFPGLAGVWGYRITQMERYDKQVVPVRVNCFEHETLYKSGRKLLALAGNYTWPRIVGSTQFANFYRDLVSSGSFVPEAESPSTGSACTGSKHTVTVCRQFPQGANIYLNMVASNQKCGGSSGADWESPDGATRVNKYELIAVCGVEKYVLYEFDTRWGIPNYTVKQTACGNCVKVNPRPRPGVLRVVFRWIPKFIGAIIYRTIEIPVAGPHITGNVVTQDGVEYGIRTSDGQYAILNWPLSATIFYNLTWSGPVFVPL